MGIGSALQQLLDDRKTNVNEVANATGISPQTIYSIIKRDSTKANIDDLANIATYLGADLNYFYYKFHHKTEKQPNQFSTSEMEHIKKYRVLDEHGKGVVDVVLNKEYERYQKMQENIAISSSIPKAKENVTSLQEQKVIYLPEPIQSASAGTGQISDDDTAEQVAVYYNEKTSKADYIMRVSGDSMEPKFMDGDHVLVRSQPAVEIGEIGIFIVDGEQYVKIYRGSYLESLNPQYNDIEVSERSFCRGKVIGVLDPEWIAE